MYSMALQDYLSQFPLYELDHDNTVRETVRAPNGTLECGQGHVSLG
jgi:hypothetical protein